MNNMFIRFSVFFSAHRMHFSIQGLISYHVINGICVLESLIIFTPCNLNFMAFISVIAVALIISFVFIKTYDMSSNYDVIYNV